MISAATWETARVAAKWRPPQGLIFSVNLFPEGDMVTAHVTVGCHTEAVFLNGDMDQDDIHLRIDVMAYSVIERAMFEAECKR